MGRSILRIENPDDASDYRYLEWSTIVDAPVTYGLTREEMVQFTTSEYGQQGLRELQDRLDRADIKGTSSWIDSSFEEAISCNRAGPNDEELDHRGLWQQYVVERPEGDVEA